MARDIQQTIREICLWLSEAEEFVSHGSPNFRVRGKTFATFVVNHHGDGRIALWLNLPAGAQETYVGARHAAFFVPPYVGPRGWLGVELNRGLAWSRVAALVREAYGKVAPRVLVEGLGETPPFKAPTRLPTPADIDPLLSARGKAVLKLLRKLCLRLPETHEVLQFGTPAWQAGKKTFATVRCADSLWLISSWVGIEQQGLLTADSRYQIPSFMGANGWIALDVTSHADEFEVAALVHSSYDHFALRRRRLARDHRGG